VKDAKRRLLFGFSVGLTGFIAGCAGALNPAPVDYQKLPGSGDRMADGPGLIGAYAGEKDGDGYTIYSDDPTKTALIHPNGSQRSSARSEHIPSKDPAVESGQAPSAQQLDYQNFQQFQQFKRFQQSPEDSSERQRFEDWKEWKQYEQWRRKADDTNTR